MRIDEVSKATIDRLPQYLKFLQSNQVINQIYVSSSAIAKNIPVSAVLVRKDIESISTQKGKPRIGFERKKLIEDIKNFLGYDNKTDVVIVGVGGLGKAFLGYEGFKNNGLNVVAAFDVNEKLIGDNVGNKKIYPMSAFEDYVHNNNINIGVITVPKEAAKETMDKMLAAGIRAIWNFAPIKLKAPKGIILKNEDLSEILAHLAIKITNDI